MFYFFLKIFFLCFFLTSLFFSNRICLKSQKDDNTESHIFELGLIFNLVGFQFVYKEVYKFFRIRVGRFSIFSKKLISKKTKHKNEEPAGSEPGNNSIAAKIRNFSRWGDLQFKQLQKPLVGMLSNFRNPKINGHIRIGFENPMATGLLMSGYSMVHGIWPEFKKNLLLEPVFTQSGMNWRITFSADFRLAVLIWRGILVWNVVRKVK